MHCNAVQNICIVLTSLTHSFALIHMSAIRRWTNWSDSTYTLSATHNILVIGCWRIRTIVYLLTAPQFFRRISFNFNGKCTTCKEWYTLCVMGVCQSLSELLMIIILIATCGISREFSFGAQFLPYAVFTRFHFSRPLQLLSGNWIFFYSFIHS